MKPLFLLILLFPFNLWAWGDLGHRIVGQIAEAHLFPTTQKAVQRILGQESLAEASTWADEIRSDPPKRIEIAKRWPVPILKNEKDPNQFAKMINQWHFTKIPITEKNYAPSKMSKWGDIVHGIKKTEDILKSKINSPLEKREALRLLVHFIGDIHQPLHVGNDLDRGGNFCWVKWFPEKYVKNITPPPPQLKNIENLHRVWDKKLVESRNLSVIEYTKRLLRANPRVLADSPKEQSQLEAMNIEDLQRRHDTKIKSWQNQDLLIWVEESRTLRTKAYPGKPKPSGLYPYCYKNHSHKIKMKDVPALSWTYRYKSLKVVDRRLLQAGVRLAERLNRILGN